MEPPPSLMRLQTRRLLMREWHDPDREAFAALNQDPQVMEHFPGPMPRTASDAFVDRLEELHVSLGYTLWVVEVVSSTRGSTSFAGFTGLMPPSFDPPFPHAEPCVEVGWRLWPQWWGLGIATEAARAAIEYGFAEVGLDEIVSFTVASNTRSRAVMERLGMQQVGEFDHPRAQPGDHWRRHVLYRIRPPRS